MDFDHVRIFHGQAHAALADVYVEIDTQRAGWTTVGGELKGPFCSLARTLPAVTPLRPLQPPHRWKAQLVDPCFWSPDHPAWYRLSLRSTDGREITGSEWGLRHLGRDRQKLRLNGRRWVLRAAGWPESVPDGNLDAWHDSRLAMWVRDPAPALCQQASRQGVLLVVWLDAARADAQLRGLARWAAVAVGILPPSPAVDPALLRQAGPTSCWAIA